MNPPVETIRIVGKNRDRLIQLKRLTGIPNWNIIARWAYCHALTLGNAKAIPEPSDAKSVVEMTWHTFAGDQDDVLTAITYWACHHERGDTRPATLAAFFNDHLSFGIACLAKVQKTEGISELVALAFKANS